MSTPETGPGVESLLRRLLEMVHSAKSMPLSSSVIVAKDDLVELLEEALQVLPEELNLARGMLRDRDEHLRRVREDGDEILEVARERAGRMVGRSELVREAERRAQRILDDAQAEARRLRREAEDYCDQRLAAFEVVIERTAKAVAGGRARLAATASQEPHDGPEPQPGEPLREDFFDQDMRE